VSGRRTRLESEQRALNTNALAPLSSDSVGTAAAKLVGSITSLTKPEAVQAVTRLSTEEQVRLAFLEKSLQDLQANDPQKLIAQLTIRAGRVRALGEHLKALENTLSDTEVGAVSMSGRRAAAKARKRSDCVRRRFRRACSPARVATVEDHVGVVTSLFRAIRLSGKGVSGRGRRREMRPLSARPRPRRRAQAQAV